MSQSSSSPHSSRDAEILTKSSEAQSKDLTSEMQPVGSKPDPPLPLDRPMICESVSQKRATHMPYLPFSDGQIKVAKSALKVFHHVSPKLAKYVVCDALPRAIFGGRLLSATPMETPSRVDKHHDTELVPTSNLVAEVVRGMAQMDKNKFVELAEDFLNDADEYVASQSGDRQKHLASSLGEARALWEPSRTKLAHEHEFGNVVYSDRRTDLIDEDTDAKVAANTSAWHARSCRRGMCTVTRKNHSGRLARWAVGFGTQSRQVACEKTPSDFCAVLAVFFAFLAALLRYEGM